MTRAAHLLASAACAFAVACSHEASAPNAAREPSSQPPAATPPARTPSVADERVAVSHDDSTGAPCIDVESEARGEHVTLEGRVFVDDVHEHPTRGKTHPYILRLDQPSCALGTDEPRVTELHLTSVEGIALKPLTGRHVRVSGDPFSAHTAWHARPVVLMATRATLMP